MFIHTQNFYVYKQEENILVDWWDFDKHKHVAPPSAVKSYSWTLDGSAPVLFNDVTLHATADRTLTLDQVKAAVEKFRRDNANIIKTIQFGQEQLKEQRKRFSDLTSLLLPALWEIDGFKFKNADWNSTEDGRLLPYLVFEGQKEKGKRTPSKSGFVCPKCFSWSVKWQGETVMTHSKDHTTWLVDYVCEACGDQWKYTKVWQD